MNTVDDKIKFLIYSTPVEDLKVNVIIKDDNIWVTQKAMADIFGVDRSNITKHIKNIIEEKELDEKATCAKIAQVQNEGGREVKRSIDYYNLDMIISVGYRVNSQRATNFRIWATNVLKEYMIKGFVLDDDRLKQGEELFGKDYFKELLERVRSIRASERRIWQQITDIFAECSIDYNKDSPITQEFYAMVQNKFHYAITGHTAAEIIYNHANHDKDHMGLQTWKNSPDGMVRKSDVTVAKNYLQVEEIRRLERTVSGYFDYIEDLIEREQTFTMEEFANSINEFLTFRKYDILTSKGSISKIEAERKAYLEYEVYNKTQKYMSDFDKSIKNLKSGTKHDE